MKLKHVGIAATILHKLFSNQIGAKIDDKLKSVTENINSVVSAIIINKVVLTTFICTTVVSVFTLALNNLFMVKEISHKTYFEVNAFAILTGTISLALCCFHIMAIKSSIKSAQEKQFSKLNIFSSDTSINTDQLDARKPQDEGERLKEIEIGKIESEIKKLKAEINLIE